MRIKSRSEVKSGPPVVSSSFITFPWSLTATLRLVAKTTEGTVPSRQYVDVRGCCSAQLSRMRATRARRHASVTAGSRDGSRGISKGLFLVGLWFSPF